MSHQAPVRAIPFGDSAVLLVVEPQAETPAADDVALDRLVATIAREAQALHAADSRFGGPVPGLSSVLVPVDPLDPGVEAALPRLVELTARLVAADPGEPLEPGPLVRIPTRYGGGHGPDLDAVAEHHALRPDDVVELHAATQYRARFLGFVPGFAYLGRVPAAIATPRLDTPRERVPAGSVAIAGEQTAVYPSPTPGGWRLIGRTELRVWDPAAATPSLLLPGTRVRFEPVR